MNDLEAAEAAIAEVRSVLTKILRHASRPVGPNVGADYEMLEQIRLVLITMDPFVSLQRGLDVLEFYCRPSCGTHGEPHEVLTGSFTKSDGTTSTEYDTGATCSCPCHGGAS